jgi:phenylalanyl-tRNA synthetase alpha chain
LEFPYTDTQKQRLIEMDAEEKIEEQIFRTKEERDRTFREIHLQLVGKARDRLERLRETTRRPAFRILEAKLTETLNRADFVEVATPTLISKGMLEKMGISPTHPLRSQIFWVDKNTCLRPMLAPNLYLLLGRLARLWPLPVRIFEVGPCFRKETKGAKHVSEFTMLNVVEMGVEGDPQARLIDLIALVMGPTGLRYDTLTESSEVYGKTTDVVVNGEEIASGAVGPHPLDANWEIGDNWAGLGVGLERLVMVQEGYKNIRRAGRSLIYLDGARLNI